MRQTIGLAAAAAIFAAWASAPAAAPGFEGTWTAKVPGPSGQSALPVTFVFHVGDGRAGGTVSTDAQTFALVDVKVDGSTIAFAIEGEEQNRYSGTLAGDTIQMQVRYSSHENGTRTWKFAMTRVAAGPAPSIGGDWEGAVPRGDGRTIAARLTVSACAAPAAGVTLVSK